MTKSELAAIVAEETGMSKKRSREAVESMLDAIRDTLSKEGRDDNNRIQLIGFGTFSVKKRKARTGRNPRTGRPLKIPAKKVPAFSPGKALRDVVK